MSGKQIVRIFGMLHSLERIVEQNRQTIEADRPLLKELGASQKEQEKVLKHMRRAANLLQLAIATNKAEQIARNLQIYYSLNHMVKEEIFHTLRRVSKHASVAASEAPEHLKAMKSANWH